MSFHVSCRFMSHVSCFLFHVSCFIFLYLISSFLLRARPPPTTQSTARGRAGESPWLVCRLSGALRTDFSDFLSHRRGIKKTCFLTLDQNTTNQRINRHLAARGSICHRCSWILGAISASIFQHFPEWLKAMKSMTASHFQLFLTYQKLSFCMFFSLVFMFFSEALSESIFKGSQRRSCLQRPILEPFSIFRKSKKRPFGRHFREKCHQGRSSKNGGGRPESVLGAIRYQKRTLDQYFHICDRFVMDC